MNRPACTCTCHDDHADRTRSALADLQAEGARLGRPVALPQEIRDRIAAERAAGRSLRAIADGLNADEIPTAQDGARWYASTVASVLRSIDLDRDAAMRTARHVIEHPEALHRTTARRRVRVQP